MVNTCMPEMNRSAPNFLPFKFIKLLVFRATILSVSLLATCDRYDSDTVFILSNVFSLQSCFSLFCL